MALNEYEGLFIFDSNRYGRDQAGVSGQIEKIIGEHSGTLLAGRLWDERRLAYPIKGQRKGTYWLTYFRIDSEQISAINRQFELSDSILRSLIIKVDPRIVDTLVEHATATAPSGGPKTDGAPDKAKPPSEKSDKEPVAAS